MTNTFFSPIILSVYPVRHPLSCTANRVTVGLPPAPVFCSELCVLMKNMRGRGRRGRWGQRARILLAFRRAGGQIVRFYLRVCCFFCFFFIVPSQFPASITHFKPFNFYVRSLKLNNITATRGGEAGSCDFVFFFFFYSFQRYRLLALKRRVKRQPTVP